MNTLLCLSHQVSNLQYEMLLLTDSISKEGGCWELRLRCGKLMHRPYFSRYCICFCFKFFFFTGNLSVEVT